MIELAQNPKWRNRFFLRRDFAYESGFVDFARTPMTPEQYAETLAFMGKDRSKAMSYSDHVAEAANYQLPRYVAYRYAIARGTMVPMPMVTDGVLAYYVANNGMWDDLLRAVNKATNRAEGERAVICPKTREAPVAQETVKMEIILHDTLTGQAGIYLHDDRFDYLRRPAEINPG